MARYRRRAHRPEQPATLETTLPAQSKADLVALAEAKGLATSGTKAELQARIEAAP